MIKDPMQPSSMSSAFPQTISDTLDRLEIPASKIGLNTAEQSFELLHGLDAVFVRMQELGPDSPSRKTAEAQLNDITAKLRKEARRFLRDLGGTQVLQQTRKQVNPPADHSWWYLDQWLDEKRRAAFKRSLVSAGILVVLFILLAVLYNRFLAPDPQFAARFGYQQKATTLLQNGDYQDALKEIESGLQIAPQDPDLLVLKGVAQEQLGQTTQAAEDFLAAEKGFGQREDFLLARSQAYYLSGQLEKALADAQAVVQLNPQSASALLLRGQIHEAQKKYDEAMDDYDLAYNAANQTGQTELAAMARIYIGMLTQSRSSQLQPEITPTPTPAP